MKRRTKRKIKKFFKNKINVVFIVALSFVLFMSSGYALLKTDLTLSGRSKIAKETTQDPEDASDVCSIPISYNVTTHWQTGDINNYSMEFVVSNASEATIYSWQFKAKLSDRLEITTGDALVSSSNGYVYFGSKDYNGEIAPGGEIKVGLNMSTPYTVDEVMASFIPVSCGRASAGDDTQYLVDGEASLELGQLEVPMNITKTITGAGIWGGSTNQYTITVTNDSEYTISSIRGVIKLADGVRLNNVYPCNKTQDGQTINFDMNWQTLTPGKSFELTLVLDSVAKDYVPDIVVAGLKANS